MLKTEVKNKYKIANAGRDECERKKSVRVYNFLVFKNYEGNNIFQMC